MHGCGASIRPQESQAQVVTTVAGSGGAGRRNIARARALSGPQSPGVSSDSASRPTIRRRSAAAACRVETAARVAAKLREIGADRVVTDLGGHGVAGVFDGAAPGPTVMLRAELDALPIEETGDVPHASTIPERGHMCGHDGHAASLLGCAYAFARQRPARGRVVLMFQPAEEDGSGAAAVIADPRFAELRERVWSTLMSEARAAEFQLERT